MLFNLKPIALTLPLAISFSKIDLSDGLLI